MMRRLRAAALPAATFALFVAGLVAFFWPGLPSARQYAGIAACAAAATTFCAWHVTRELRRNPLNRRRP
jgi:hypothetical protein